MTIYYLMFIILVNLKNLLNPRSLDSSLCRSERADQRVPIRADPQKELRYPVFLRGEFATLPLLKSHPKDSNICSFFIFFLNVVTPCGRITFVGIYDRDIFILKKLGCYIQV